MQIKETNWEFWFITRLKETLIDIDFGIRLKSVLNGLWC